METPDTEVELTSKQKRRAKKRAAVKAIAGTTVDSAPVKIKAIANVPSASDLKSTIADAAIPNKSKAPLRKPNKVGGIAKVATLEGSESEIDPALMAELANLVRECAASNPDAVEDTKPVDSVETKRLPGKKRIATAIEEQEPAETVQQKPAQKHLKGAGKEKNSSWNFAVDYNDHFETPLVAYTDILPMLLTLAESLGKLPKDLVIYDPYYCQGGMVQMLAGMGFPKVFLFHLNFDTEKAVDLILVKAVDLTIIDEMILVMTVMILMMTAMILMMTLITIMMRMVMTIILITVTGTMIMMIIIMMMITIMMTIIIMMIIIIMIMIMITMTIMIAMIVVIIR
jgi:hypothetical protein